MHLWTFPSNPIFRSSFGHSHKIVAWSLESNKHRNLFSIKSGNTVLNSSSTLLKWTRITKTGGGYCVMAHDPNYDENDEDPENNTEPWYINEDLIYCIEQYYTQNPNEGVLVISKNNDEDGDGNDHEQEDDDDGSSTISTS